MKDMIYREDAIKALGEEPLIWCNTDSEIAERDQWRLDRDAILAVPSTQPERDIPMKPNETMDSSWGIRKKQAVCPKCDTFLNHIEFIGDQVKPTYCEFCGQAINWEGWEWEE